MDYLIGSIATLATIFFVSKRLRLATSRLQISTPLYTQSQTFHLTRFSEGAYLYDQSLPLMNIKTQSTDFFDKQHTRVVIYDDHAYWVINNALYTAEFDGKEVVKDSAKEVDTMGMSKVELDHMVFIVDLLTEGNSNDFGNSGNS